jgi:membrane dipeptidase
MRSVTIVRVPSMLLTTLCVLSCSGPSDSTLWERANRIHEEAVVIDAHAHPKPGAAETLSLGEKTAAFEVDFVTMREGGLDAVFFSVPMLTSESGGRPESVLILEDARAVADEVERFGDLAETAHSSADISRIHTLGKRAVLLGVEAGDPFGGDIGTLERFFDAGIRMVTLSPEALTAPIPGQGDQSDSGLNGFGKRVIEEMNRLGIIIDITHTPDSLQLDIIGTSVKPVVASHSCTRALNDIPRQMPDFIIQALAEKGGVICVTFYPGHISGDYPDQIVTIEDLVDHIDHIVQIAGVDHVGFGSDFLGSEHHTVGLESAAGLPAITYSLLQRGYSQGEIEKILGGNLLRVFERVQESGR